MMYFRLTVVFLLVGLINTAPTHAYTIFTDEAAFKQSLTGVIEEGFENEAAWGTVRSAGPTINATASVIHQGITWSSPDRISTSLGAGKDGYGIFAYEPQIPDRLAGESAASLKAIGFWARSNTPPAKLHLVLDGGLRVDFNDAELSTLPVFYGVVVPEGFTRFELVEQEGAIGDEKRFSADSFTFATGADVTPPPLPPPPPTPADPTVDAGINQVATEGDGITLIGSATGSDGSAIVSYLWEQIGGPAAPLSHPNAAETRLVAPPLSGADTDLRFRLTVTDANGGQAQDEVLVMVMENGITAYPAGAYTFHSVYGDPLGLTLGTGVELVDLHEVDPADLAGTGTFAPPDQIPYGLFDFILKVDPPGSTAEVTFWLPDVADPLAGWYKHTANGWQSLETQVVFSADGDRATLSLTDGGNLDADGQADGYIVDPSGLAWYGAAAPPAPPPSDPDNGGSPGDGSAAGSSSGGGGGCFLSLLQGR